MTEAAGTFVRVLFVEDNPDDVELELAALRAGGLTVQHRTVESTEELRAALEEQGWDVVICDHGMPELSGADALRLAKQVSPATPFILVSGTGGEDVAVEAMRGGADDYVLRDNLTRLASAVHRELRDAERRRSGILSEQALRLLADVGAALGKSLTREDEDIVGDVPALVVRDFGKLCSIDLLDEPGTVRRAAIAHADPRTGELLARLDAAHPPRGPHEGAGQADGAFLEIAGTLGLEGAVSVPIVSEQRVVGTIHLARRSPYSPLEVKIIEELSGRVAVAIENASLYERARRAIQLRDEFLSVASHELRTPLAALHLQIQGLRDLARKQLAGSADERLVRRLDRSAASVDRLAQLVDRLLDVSRISEGRLQLTLEPLDLNAVVRDAAERFHEQAQRAGCDLRLRAAPASVAGTWDRLKLEQVLTNLLSNAIKYGAGKPIEVEAADAGDEAVLTVVDHGIGIPPTDLDRIFGRFERAVSTRRYGGLGLGLFISRRIVEAHGGSVTAKPTPSGGATLVVTIPKQAAVTSSTAETTVTMPALGPVSAAAPPRSSWAAGEALAFVREVKDYAIYMIDPEGKILTWNQGAHAIKGYEPEEIIGESFERFFTPEDRAQGRPRQILAKAAEEGRIEDLTWRVRKDGSRFWADVVITAVHDEAGQLRGFVKVTRDLTERRAAEAQLRQSEERLRLLVESVKDYAIFMLDPEGRVTTWNSGAEGIKGYRADEIIGKHFSIFYPREALDAHHPEHELELATRNGRYEEEGWRLRKDGTRFWANVVITAIRDPDTGLLRGFAKVTRDLTERRRMEEAARAAEAQIGQERRRAEEARGELLLRDEFISIAAHELRTPLSALMLKLQSVGQGMRKAGEKMDPGVSARLAERLEGGLRQIERLSELVERLLDVSHIVQGKLAMILEPTNLAEIAGRVVEDFREPALQAGCELRFQAQADVTGMWDKARLEQVVVNLLSNAIKYGAGKPVEVAVEAIDGGARLVVVDHGIGVEPEDLERIFTRFERAAPLRHYGGMGLGLYITRSIVEAHGGTIRVASRPGEATTFMADLPRSRTVSASNRRDREEPRS